MKMLKLSVIAFTFVAHTIPAVAERQKRIDFEDTLVEGVNRQPLDSLSQVSEDNNHKKPRLYRKRGGFRDLIPETLNEMRLVK